MVGGLLLTIGGIIYGLVLIITTFHSNKILDSLRLDYLFLGNNASPSTRPINLVVGLIVLGYNLYILYQSYLAA